MKLRQANKTDIDSLVRLRMALFEEVDGECPTTLVEPTRKYFEDYLGGDSFVTWVATDDNGSVIATQSLAIFQRSPYPGNLSGREAYLFNVYTVPPWRLRGVATALLGEAMAFIEFEKLDRVWLHASAAGRPIYEKAGFVLKGTEMEWMSP